MRVFKMNGVQITGIQQFREHFSPEDFLRSRELAAGFAHHHMRSFSAWTKYHSELLLQTVFLGIAAFGGRPVKEPQDYFALTPVRMNLTEREKDALDMLAEDPAVHGTLQSVWSLSEQTNLTKTERIQLFSILTAGYLLAEKTPSSCPISAEEAQYAFLKKTLPEKDAHKWFSFGNQARILLEPRPEPYYLLYGEDTAAHLKAGAAITLCKISAASADTMNSVVLEVYRSKKDPHPRRVTIKPGDYRYANLINGELAVLHPTAVTNETCTMSRERNMFRLQVPGKPDRMISCKSDIVSFAPEAQGQGWILAEPDGLDLSHYSMQQVYGYQLDVWNVVQIKMLGDTCLLLDDTGSVTSNIQGIHMTNITDLDQIEAPH